MILTKNQIFLLQRRRKLYTLNENRGFPGSSLWETRLKRNKCDECDWVGTGRKKYPWKCQVCEDTFPCKQKDCGHLDCHVESARSCHVCEKRIPNTGNVFYFLDGRGVDMYAIHKGCEEADFVVKTYE